MRHKNTLRSLIIATVATFGMTAFAQNSGTSNATFPKVSGPTATEERKPHVGLLLGTYEPTGGQNGGADYGIDVGFQPYIPFGVGLELGASGNESEQVRLLAKGSYNFGGDIPVIKNSYVGLAAGTVWGSEGDKNKVLLGAGPILGFDIPLTAEHLDHLSLGLQAKYLVIEGSDPEAVAVNAELKYWW